nr:hypothetical protein [Myxococcota bacterium]
MNRLHRFRVLALIGIVSLLHACGGGESLPSDDDAGADASAPGDGGPRDAGRACSADAECDDGLFCNGAET